MTPCSAEDEDPFGQKYLAAATVEPASGTASLPLEPAPAGNDPAKLVPLTVGSAGCRQLRGARDGS